MTLSPGDRVGADDISALIGDALADVVAEDMRRRRVFLAVGSRSWHLELGAQPRPDRNYSRRFARAD